MESIAEGHRKLTGLGTSGGIAAGSVGEGGAVGPIIGVGRSRPSADQPCGVRAFFLRFASLRFRFTLGFS
jgi:hypothetical protein